MTRMQRTAVLCAVMAVLAGLFAACDATDAATPVADHSPAAKGKHSRPPVKIKPKKKVYPTGPPMLLEGIAPLDNTTVGVAMPISMTFTYPVAPKARKGIEDAIDLKTSTPVVGAWHWFGDQRLDFRPKKFWPAHTKVSMTANFNHVADGNGRYGTHPYTRKFTIGDDVRTHVYVQLHKTVVKKDGKVIRTMPSNAGSPEFASWNGIMAVVDTERTTRMTSCSVGIACNKNDPNYYDLVLPWDVRLTSSGTFVHYSTADPSPGSGNASHGCIHLSYDNAEWFYNFSKQGDPVTITGSTSEEVSGDNGYSDYTVDWPTWLSGSGRGAFTTTQL